jgi:hypothetical protein
MAKSWSKPFNAILSSKSGAWKDAKKQSEQQGIIEEVVEAIKTQLATTDGEDRTPPQLERVSIVSIMTRNIS